MDGGWIAWQYSTNYFSSFNELSLLSQNSQFRWNIPSICSLFNEFLTKAIEETRNLSHQIAEVITPENFVEKLSEIFSMIDNNNIQLDTFYPKQFIYNCSYDTLFHLYRIVQEIVNNVIKHAKASHLIFDMKCDLNYLFISVEDNGVGFDKDNSDDFGLTSLKRRIDKIDADYTIETSKGNGCTYKIYLGDAKL